MNSPDKLYCWLETMDNNQLKLLWRFITLYYFERLRTYYANRK